MSKISHTDAVDEGPFPETIVVAHLDGTSRAYVRADGPELQETIDRAVATEREACALLCDDEGLQLQARQRARRQSAGGGQERRRQVRVADPAAKRAIGCRWFFSETGAVTDVV